MSDLCTLIMGLLVHSWFEIMEFSQFLIISTFWSWKSWKWLISESGQISVKRDNIFELSLLNQIYFFIERKFGVFLRSKIPSHPVLLYCSILQNSKHLAYTESIENSKSNYISKKCRNRGWV